jgi:hypothetical protein
MYEHAAGTRPSCNVQDAAINEYEDPLEEDAEDDEVVVTSRRSLVRLALVAAETAARFAREELAHDPVAWLLAPRRVFGGRAAIQACLEREFCVRALLLHGLGFGLDADAAALDDVVSGEDDWPGDGFADPQPRGDALDQIPQGPASAPRLYTSVIVDAGHLGRVFAFNATVAQSRAEAENRLMVRHGRRLAAEARIVEGFSGQPPSIWSMLSPAMADMLREVEADPCSPLAAGLEVSVEQRFAA